MIFNVLQKAPTAFFSLDFAKIFVVDFRRTFCIFCAKGY